MGSARLFTTTLQARQEWAQLRAERAASAAFASTSGSTDGKRRATKQVTEEQQDTRRRADAKQAGLRSVAGIGPKNEQRLLSKGISSVDILAEVFNDHKKRDEQKMVSYLQVNSRELCQMDSHSSFIKYGSPDMQDDVGIRRRHCVEIVRHIAELPCEGGGGAEQQCSRAAWPVGKVTLCVEGNISAGKTTFLQKLMAGSVELRDIVEVWQPANNDASHACLSRAVISKFSTVAPFGKLLHNLHRS